MGMGRYTPEEIKRLGTAPDPVVAARLGRPVASVLAARSHRGIPPGISQGGRSGERLDWSRWDRLLGKLSDVEIARRMGCSSVAVFKRRRKLGIPPAG